MTLLLPTKACSLLPPSSSNTHDIYPIAYYPKITPSPYFSGPLLPVPNKKKNSVTFDVLDVIGVELVEESRIFFFNTKKTRWNKKRWTATTTKLGKPPPPKKNITKKRARVKERDVDIKESPRQHKIGNPLRHHVSWKKKWKKKWNKKRNIKSSSPFSLGNLLTDWLFLFFFFFFLFGVYQKFTSRFRSKFFFACLFVFFLPSRLRRSLFAGYGF